MATILCWYKCDHVAPVFEEDILASRISVLDVVKVASGRLLKLGIEVFAERISEDGEVHKDLRVLDWQLAVLAKDAD